MTRLFIDFELMRQQHSISDNQIKPITIRQVAIAALLLIIATALIVTFILRHKAHQKLNVKSPLIIPKIIRHETSSDPQSFESMTFVVPLTK